LDYKDAFNPGYAVFGKVVQGMDIVDSIASETTGTFNGFRDVPITDVLVTMALQTQ
jgi:cyclophilin family peptidyl-prolyl cis-trans isomerase